MDEIKVAVIRHFDAEYQRPMYEHAMEYQGWLVIPFDMSNGSFTCIAYAPDRSASDAYTLFGEVKRFDSWEAALMGGMEAIARINQSIINQK